MSFDVRRYEISMLTRAIAESPSTQIECLEAILALLNHERFFDYLHSFDQIAGKEADEQFALIIESINLREYIRSDIEDKSAQEGQPIYVVDNDFRIAETFVRKILRG